VAAFRHNVLDGHLFTDMHQVDVHVLDQMLACPFGPMHIESCLINYTGKLYYETEFF
jgi:hypothetical protein